MTEGEVEEFSGGQSHDRREKSHTKVCRETHMHGRRVRYPQSATGGVAHFLPKHKVHSHPSAAGVPPAFTQAPGVGGEELGTR